MWAEKKNQNLIKYFRKKFFNNIFYYVEEQEDPEEEQKKQIWNLFYYESVFNPLEWNRYIKGSISYNEMMSNYNYRENDDYFDYIIYLYGEGYFNGGYYGDLDAYSYWYDDWYNLYWRYRDGEVTRDDYIKFTKGYTLWILNNNIGWTLDDEGGYISDPPASWQPLENPPDLTLPDLGYVGTSLELFYYDGQYYYLVPCNPPDPPFTPIINS